MINRGVIGDIHCRPGDTLHHLMSSALEKFDEVINLGDCFELMPYGIDIWRSRAGRLTIASVAGSAKKMIVIPGNEEGPARWVKELYAPHPHVTVLDEYEFTADDGRTYWFRHGSEYSEWRTIQPMADLITIIMSYNPLIRGFWHRWCTLWGYLPKNLLDEPFQKIELDSKVIRTAIGQNLFGERGVRGVWEKALRAAEKRGNTVHFIAHTHRSHHLKGKNGSEVFNLKPRHIVELRV